MGIALSTTGYEHPEELLRDADAAMFNAKRLGRTRYTLFDDAMRERMAERARIEDALRRAVRCAEFRLVYQPVYDLRPRRLRGFEALLRWRTPDGRELVPAEFLGVAESTGLIHAIGAWAIREACRQMREWLDESPGADLALLVNLSTRQLARRSLPDDLAAVLEETGLPARQLRVEITEKALESADAAAAALGRLRALGAGVHLDDFGTGMASLSHLDRFPIDALKLDRPLVSGLAGQAEAPVLVRSILAVARTRGLQVIAEGVELPAQLEALVAHGCDQAQGHLLGAPLPPEEVAALIADQGAHLEA